MSEPVVRLVDVTKRFGDLQVLDGVSLDIHSGEVVALLGPAGSGKSTLCRTINGLETIDTGRIEVLGAPLPSDPIGLAALRERVGMVFQGFNLFRTRTVLDNVTLGPIKVLGLSTDAAHARGIALLTKVGVADQAAKRPTELSGGQQQRVAIARALAMDPAALLFDEPTSALDPEMVGEVMGVVTALAREGRTMLVVTHEMSFARDVASRIVFMDAGVILEDTTPERFFTAPATDRARDFLNRGRSGS